VDVFARRLQVQERMTREVADTIDKYLSPLGVAVVCEGQHMCMAMRGVEKQNSSTVTSAMTGAFKEPKTRAEFMTLISK
ncbi:MAG TPA: GTP cyclohydrolase I, partial [Blastocatellia bacterium]|nr:GTP cyclohydrolase I [Blastocatellia bacterium]